MVDALDFEPYLEIGGCRGVAQPVSQSRPSGGLITFGWGLWRRESVRMGTIYENAEITLAASHSKDSHQGLFFQRKDYEPPVELPGFQSLEGDRGVKVFATL